MSCQLRVGRHHRRVVGCGAPNWSNISIHCSIPDYGLHGVLHVTICGISGMHNTVAATMGNFAAVVVRNLL